MTQFPVYEEDETCYYNYQCAIALPGYVPYVHVSCFAVNIKQSITRYVFVSTVL